MIRLKVETQGDQFAILADGVTRAGRWPLSIGEAPGSREFRLPGRRRDSRPEPWLMRIAPADPPSSPCGSMAHTACGITCDACSKRSRREPLKKQTTIPCGGWVARTLRSLGA